MARRSPSVPPSCVAGSDASARKLRKSDRPLGSWTGRFDVASEDPAHCAILAVFRRDKLGIAPQSIHRSRQAVPPSLSVERRDAPY